MDIFSLLDSLRGIARDGLHYTQDPFDRERYERLLDLAVQTYTELLEVPGEAIRGYITRTHSITVHRAECPNLARLLQKEPEREMAVSWRNDQDPAPVNLRIEALDRSSLLSDLTAVLSNESVRILAMDTRLTRNGGLAIIRVTIVVPGLALLSRILLRMSRIPGVQRAVRESSR